MGGRQIVQTFLHGPPLMRVTLLEGWTAKQMAAALEAKNVTLAKDFLEQVRKGDLEGYLFPDTYFFDQALPAAQVVQRLVKRFREKAPSDFAAQAAKLRLSERQLVTLASLVEKEARVPEERPMIAGVYLNRLRKRMRLEADPTVQYALGGWKEKLTYKDLDVKSPYNTYRRFGLPPGPIANPGAASLAAAAHPAQTDALFFFAEGGGKHRFSRTYAEHMAGQKALKQQRKAAK
jgi:UPF0755 protein